VQVRDSDNGSELFEHEEAHASRFTLHAAREREGIGPFVLEQNAERDEAREDDDTGIRRESPGD
jgi:hypothetical protein